MTKFSKPADYKADAHMAEEAAKADGKKIGQISGHDSVF